MASSRSSPGCLASAKKASKKTTNLFPHRKKSIHKNPGSRGLRGLDFRRCLWIFFLGEKSLSEKPGQKQRLTVLVSVCLFMFRKKTHLKKKVGILGGTWQLLFCFTLWGVVWFDSIKTKHFNQRLKEFWTSDQHESNLPNTSLTCGVLLLLTNPTEPTVKGLRFTSSYRVILEVVKKIGCNTPYRSCNTQL